MFFFMRYWHRYSIFLDLSVNNAIFNRFFKIFLRIFKLNYIVVVRCLRKMIFKLCGNINELYSSLLIVDLHQKIYKIFFIHIEKSYIPVNSLTVKQSEFFIAKIKGQNKVVCFFFLLKLRIFIIWISHYYLTNFNGSYKTNKL